jgi:hypothetical protein
MIERCNKDSFKIYIFYPFEKVKTIAVGHFDIEKNDLGLMRFDSSEPCVDRFSKTADHNIGAILFQIGCKNFAAIFFVIDNNSFHVRG